MRVPCGQRRHKMQVARGLPRCSGKLFLGNTVGLTCHRGKKELCEWPSRYVGVGKCE